MLTAPGHKEAEPLQPLRVPSRIMCGEGSSFSWDVHAFGSVSSTNDLVKEALRAGAPEGYCATALKQTGGYGRQGRAWSSPVGGLYTSFALRPVQKADQLPTLSLVMSLALHAALARMGAGEALAVKWPNDLLWGKAKLSGISLEAVAGGICVGVGVNVFEPAEATAAVRSAKSGKYEFAYLSRIANGCCSALDPSGASSLSGTQRFFMEELLAVFLEEVGRWYCRWNEGGFASCRQAYEDVLCNKGAAVAMETVDGKELLQGTVEGVDEQGRLVLKRKDGTLVAASSGEVHVISLP